MNCEACGKGDATVHLTNIMDGKMQKFDLCENCAKKFGVNDPAGFSLQNLLEAVAANRSKLDPN